MQGITLANGTAKHPDTNWNTIDWHQQERRVQNLRQRIFRATQAGDWKYVRSLQKLMLRSRANRLVSVRRVAQLNHGKKTPGVDKVLLKTPAARGRMVDQLAHCQIWTAKPARRVYIYVRYADDWVLGFSGPKEEAEEIKRELRAFLHDTLKLKLSEEKTLLTHARTGAAKFLGYQIVSQHVDDKLDHRGQRQVNEMVALRVPKEIIEQKCALYMRRGKPAQRGVLIRDSDYSIVSKYQSEYRGIVQYYLLAHNVGWFNKLHWIAETSLLKTLAGKHRSTVTKMAKRCKATIETPHGPRKCLQVVVQRDNKKPLVTHFGGVPLKRKQDAILVDRLPQFVMTNRSELLQRMLADTCELCGSHKNVEVHHIRKLADLEKPGRREKPVWVKQMAARQRKTLIVCRKCHEEIHAGTSTAAFRKQGLESRMTRKRSSPVREKGNGKGP